MAKTEINRAALLLAILLLGISFASSILARGIWLSVLSWLTAILAVLVILAGRKASSSQTASKDNNRRLPYGRNW